MTKNSTNTTLKFLIYILIFMIIVFAFVLLIVIPGIKEYKGVQSDYAIEKKSYSALQEEQSKLEARLKEVKQQNKKVINIFSKEFNKTDFITNAKKYFDDAELKQIQNETNSSALKVYQFSADTHAQNPQRFYAFVKELQAYEGIVKINFPITISTENKLLKINFHMSVYSMRNK